MKLTVNGELLNTDPMTAASPIATVMNVIQDLSANSLYIQQVVVNGEEQIVEAVRQGQVWFDESADVMIDSCNLDEMIEGAIESSQQLLPQLTQNILGAGRAFRVGDLAIGSKVFASTLQAVEWHVELLNSIANLQPGPSYMHDMRDGLIANTKALFEAWENEDFVSLADVIEYEMHPWLVKWLSVIQMFRRQMTLEHAKNQLNQAIEGDR